MRESPIVLLAAASLCVGIADAGRRQEPETRLAPDVADRTRWQPWRAPADTPLSATQEALRADLIRHVEETVDEVPQHAQHPGIDEIIAAIRLGQSFVGGVQLDGLTM